MGLEKLIKREIAITIATVTLVTTVFLMFSYAIFKVEAEGENNVISFGDVSMSFCADSTCNNTLTNIGNVIGTKTENGVTSYVPIYPQKDPSTTAEWDALTPYTFTLTNSGSLDLYISLYLTKDPSTDLKYSYENVEYSEPVNDDQIKIAIGEQNSTPTIKLYSDKNDLTSFETFTIPAYQTKTTFAPTRNTEFCYLFLGSFTAGTEFNLKEYGVMVYEGTENKEFEQYGTMPSLEFSSEIESVGDNVNLFNKDTISENKYINLGNGALGNSTTSNTSDYIKVSVDEEYVLSYEYETLLATGKRVCCYFDENKNYIKGIEYTSTNKETVFSSSQNGYIRFSYDINAYNVKLEKGTKLTSYSEFGQGSVEIRKSKANVYDISKFTQGFWNSAANTGVTGWLCKVVKGQKVIVNKKNNKLDYVIGLTTLDYRDSTNVRISESGWQSGEKFEMTAIDDGYIFLQVKKNNNSNITSAELLADGFEIYCVNKTHILQIQRKMLKGDYFDIANKKEVHKWTELVLDTEKINKLTEQNTDTTGMYRYLYKLTENVSITDKTHAQGYCTHYSMTASSGTYKKEKGFAVSRSTSDKKMYLCIYDEGETLEEFKTKIANKEIKFYLQLETPIELGCTDEQIAVLNELENMTTYADKTIITIDNNMTEMTVEAEQSRISMIEEKLKKEETV